MRAAIYTRVSTNNGQDPSMQTRELREYCQRRSWGIEGEYVDAGVSGAKERRPQLDAFLIACRKRCVDALSCNETISPFPFVIGCSNRSARRARDNPLSYRSQIWHNMSDRTAAYRS
jgi:Resolvase, N terminal domain